MSFAVASAVVVVLLCIVLVTVSVTGTVAARLGFETATPAELPPGSDIAGWASFDKASYLPGELARYEIRVLWRNDVVTPDLEAFRSSINFFPFDYKDSTVDERSGSDGIREYALEYSLQAVNVDSPASYQFDLATLYYTSSREDSEVLQSLRIRPPRVYIGEFYPRDISAVPLKAMQGEIRDPRTLRQGLMSLFALALASIAGILVWLHGRKRPDSALSEAERLWLEIRKLRHDAVDDQQYMLDSERIFTHALRLRSDIGPARFWSEKDINLGEWRDLIGEARQIFGRNYSDTKPIAADADKAAALIGKLLEPLVSAERLLREQQPSFAMRLKQKPGVLATGASLAAIAVVMIVLAALPSVWVASDVRRYNDAIRLIEQDEDLEEAYVQLALLADDTDEEILRAASLYNLGTLGADHRMAAVSELQQRAFLRAIFMPEITLDKMLHALELDAEAELLTMLGDSVRRYVEAEEAMKGAVRISPDHEDSRRNLEILGKVRRALADTLTQLLQQSEQGDGSVEMQRQSVIDLRMLMETELPEEFSKLDAGKDDSNYLILEGF